MVTNGIPSDGRILWTKLVTEIPSGWSRDNDFNDRFLQGDATPETNAGSSNHTHTADAHTHIQDSHTHLLTITGAAVTSSIASPAALGLNSTPDGHTHPSIDSVAATATNQNTTVSISTETEQPIHTTVIILKPDSDDTDVPVDGIVFSASSIIPTDFSVTDGTGGTTDLDGDFLKTAPALDNGGGGTGGSANHNHDSLSHNHTQDAHTHADSFFGDSPNSLTIAGTSFVSQRGAHHKATSISSVTATNQTTLITIDNASSDPEFINLLGLQNRGASASTPDRIIVPFVSASAPPNPWIICNGSNGTPDLTTRQIKVTTKVVQIGVLGGANTHTHTSPNHTHTQNTHGHTFTLTHVLLTTITVARSGTAVSQTTHTHTSNDMDNTAAVNQLATVTMSTDDIRYLYRTVRFIMKNVFTVHVKGADILGADIK